MTSLQPNSSKSLSDTTLSEDRLFIKQQNEEDKDILELSKAVEELHDITLNVGQILQKQTETLSSIETKTNRVHEKTVAVTLKSAQISNYTKSSKPKLIGYYQFEYLSGEGLYLSINSVGDIVLIPKKDRSTVFNLFVKENNIYALQNQKTLTYLCVTWIGAARGVGQSFSAAEELHLDLRVGEVTGIFFLNCNWGGGGWLKSAKTKKTNDKTFEPIALYLLSSGISDKEKMANFLATPVKIIDENVSTS
jgi:hypothetical protein